jgi:hypothetical protein
MTQLDRLVLRAAVVCAAAVCSLYASAQTNPTNPTNTTSTTNTSASAPPPAQASPAAPGGGAGVGDLLVAPTRVVLEGRERAAELSLINIGPEAATYRISFVHMAMTENGELKEIEKPAGAITAEDLIRYSPRQITLQPNVAQVVRMQVRKPADLPDGEYRAHLLFRAVPREDAAPQQNVEAQAGKAGTGFSIKLTPIYGVSIPVIVRSGATSATSSISEVHLVSPGKEGDPPQAEFKLSRTGNQSVYGNITISFTPAGGPTRVVGLVNGLAVYTPNPMRTVRAILNPPPGTVVRGGRLSVVFSKAEQNGERLAEAALDVP